MEKKSNIFKKIFEPVDMLEGTPWKKILAFSLPMIIGNIAQQLYSTVDSIVVGRYIGDNALAAVGSAGPIFNLLLVLFVGISTGAGIMVAQYFGARDREALNKAVGNSLTLTLIASVFLMALAPFVIRPLLTLLNTPESIMEWCYSYLMILFMGILGCSFYNILCGILRGLGDSMSALYYLLVATVLNIVLDIFFVATLHMGVGGVSLATAIAQGVSAILCIFKLKKMTDVVDLKWSYLKLDGAYAGRLVSLGLPSGITQLIFGLSTIVVQSLTNSFGELFIAANVIIMRVDGFAMMPNFSYGAAMTTYAGQNVGARNLDRVKKGARQGTAVAVITAASLTALILIFGRWLMGIFTSTAELVDLGMYNMRIIAFGYLCMAVTQCLSGVMRGAGDTVTPMWISMFTSVICRVPLAYGIAYFTRSAEYPIGRSECIFVSLLLAWIAGALLNFILYKKGKWLKKAEESFSEKAPVNA